MKRKGWFKIPGVQDGDRTLAEQMLAVRPALDEARGKTVLDLGCAEGLIGLEFSKAGAAHVLGLDTVEDHLKVAAKLCAGRQMRFVLANLNDPPRVKRHDIVLALSVIHKLRDPAVGLRWAAMLAGSLFLIRSGRGERDGRIYSKHEKGNFADRDAVLTQCGLRLERVVRGPDDRGEDVQYWRR